MCYTFAKEFIPGDIKSVSINLPVKEAIDLFHSPLWQIMRNRYAQETGGLVSAVNISSGERKIRKIKVVKKKKIDLGISKKFKKFSKIYSPSMGISFSISDFPSFPYKGMSLTRYSWERKLGEVYLNLVFHSGNRGCVKPFSTEIEADVLLHTFWDRYRFCGCKVFEQDDCIDLSLSFPVELNISNVPFTIFPTVSTVEGKKVNGIWIPKV